MNKFAEWMKNNDKTQRGVATKLGISTSSLHDILRKNQLPSLKVAYEIEKYTRGEVTMYDWFDQRKEETSIATKTKVKTKPKNITK